MNATANEINHDQWTSFFQQISEQYKGQPVTLQQSGAHCGVESVVRGLPFLEITMDEEREEIDPIVRVKAGDLNDGIATDFVAAPSHIHFTNASEGKIGAFLEIDSITGQSLLVQFAP